jgi:hypothetical protein
MYFSKLPNLEYNKKPIQFPISDSEYVVVKNLFRRFVLSEKGYESALYYNKYTMTDDDRPDTVSNKFYNTPNYDWLILLANNVINPYYDLPIKEVDLYEFVSNNYDNPDGIHHYETLEVKNSQGVIVQKSGINVDERFATTQHKFYNGGTYLTKNGSDICAPITNFDYEKRLNDAKREIYILRPEFVEKFVNQLENLMEYSRSSDYIDASTKKGGI